MAARSSTGCCRCLHSTAASTSQTTRARRLLPQTRRFSLATAPVPTPTPALPPTAQLLKDLHTLLLEHPLLLNQTTWSARVERAVTDLLAQRRARIVVIGDRESGTSALVTSAFDDPLSSDEDLSVALASRRLGDDPPEAITFTYAPKTRVSRTQLGVPSSWLRDNKLELIEIVHDGESPTSPDELYASDAIVLHTPDSQPSDSPFVSPLVEALLLEHAGNPNLFLALESPTLTMAPPVQYSLDALLAPGKLPEVLLVSSEMAMAGLAALAPDDPDVPVSFEKFQKDFVGSGVPRLMERLRAAVASLGTPASERGIPSELQLQTAIYVLNKALGAVSIECEAIEDTLLLAAVDIVTLSLIGKEETEKALTELGVVDGALKVPSDELKESMAALASLFRHRLAWWKLPLRSDDITAEVAVAVQDSYLRRFEDRLIFSTGKLVSLSSTLSDSTDELLSTASFVPNPAIPLASLHSPVLLNRVAQAALEATKIPSTALSSPIVHRRRQITAPGGPAEVLQARAQQSFMSAVSLTTGSVGAGLVAHFLEYADLATNFGVGLLGVVTGAWWLQRGWMKATRRFFVDVEQRVTGGLEDDLGVAAAGLVERSAFKLRTAVVGAENLLQRRRKEYETITAEVLRIKREPKASQ